MEFIWKKWLYKYIPYEACGSLLDLIQYCTERKLFIFAALRSQELKMLTFCRMIRKEPDHLITPF